MATVYTNIRKIWGLTSINTKEKRGAEMQQVDVMENAWILCENGIIVDLGTGNPPPTELHINLNQMEILPGFVDSHTHCVFAEPRSSEWVHRIEGKSYEEIASNGGGIINSALKLRQLDEQYLFETAAERVQRMIEHGTTTMEIKSGYGLDLNSELKMLRVIARLKQQFPITIKSTLLAAHAFPPEFKLNPQAYIDLIINEIMPAAVHEKLVDFVDVFCDKGFFSVEQTREILIAANSYKLPAKIHANELGLTGGVQIACEMNAYSADHLEHCEDEEFECLKNSETVPVALPGTSYFLGIPYAPVKRMITHNLPVALASDFNPGSSPVCSMQMIWSLACTQMKMLPTEAFNAITLNAARALRLEHEIGSICIGKKANFICVNNNDAINEIPYFFGINHVKKVIVNGKPIV